MKFVFGLVVVMLLGWMLLPIPLVGQQGAYNTISRSYVCFERWACYHEIGHYLDQRAGWVSRSQEFSDAIRLTVVADSHSAISIEIVTMLLSSDREETYANLFAISEGNPEKLPAGLRPFFDWELGNRMIQRDRLLSGGVMNDEIEVEFDENNLIHKGECGGWVYRSIVDNKLTCLGCGEELTEEDVEEYDGN